MSDEPPLHPIDPNVSRVGDTWESLLGPPDVYSLEQREVQDLDHRAEDARQLIVRRLLWLLTGVVGGSIVTVLFTSDPTVLDFLQYLVAALVGLIGTAVGFYFGKGSY